MENLSQKGFLARQHPFVQFFMLILFSLVGMTVFTLLAFVLSKPLFHVIGIDALIQEANSHPEKVSGDATKINALKFLEVMSTIGTFLFPAVIFSLLSNSGGDFFKLKKKVSAVSLLLIPVIVILSFPVISLLIEWNERLHLPWPALQKSIDDAEKGADSLTSIFLNMPTLSAFFINLLMMAFLPAFCEELIFRGCLVKLFSGWFKNFHTAIWVSGAIFSFIHFQFYGFFPRMLLGVMLGYLFYWSGSLWAPVAAHAFWNGLQLLLSYLFQHKIISFDFDGEGTIPPGVMIVSAVFVIAALFLFYRNSKRNNSFLTPDS